MLMDVRGFGNKVSFSHWCARSFLDRIWLRHTDIARQVNCLWSCDHPVSFFIGVYLWLKWVSLQVSYSFTSTHSQIRHHDVPDFILQTWWRFSVKIFVHFCLVFGFSCNLLSDMSSIGSVFSTLSLMKFLNWIEISLLVILSWLCASKLLLHLIHFELCHIRWYRSLRSLVLIDILV